MEISKYRIVYREQWRERWQRRASDPKHIINFLSREQEGGSFFFLPDLLRYN